MNEEKLDYGLKITNDRFMNPTLSIDVSTESDRGRIINCSAIRRLQQRTQVFPLEGDATIRSRLTHSLEVQQVGRYIVREILKKAQEKEIEFFVCEDDQKQKYRDAFISLVEMACLSHDIGNPPFGHFGERAIRDWTKEMLGAMSNKEQKKLLQNEQWSFKQISKDLMEFDGNAQGIRIVVSLQQLNLTYSQIASFLKYTRGAFEEKKMKKIDKKSGFYLSEYETIKKIRETLNISERNRFPLAYIMEAADDISYGIADIEDALNKEIIKLEELIEYIEALGSKRKSSGYEIVVEDLKEKLNKAKEQEHNSMIAHFMIALRAKIQRKIVPQVADNYLANHQDIFNGNFDGEILKINDTCEDPWLLLLGDIKSFTQEKVFPHKIICEKEIKGYYVLTGLLNVFQKILKIDRRIIKCERLFSRKYPLEHRLYQRLPEKYRIAYSNAIQKKDLPEMYYRVRLILDYISGMTDDFAVREYRELVGII